MLKKILFVLFFSLYLEASITLDSVYGKFIIDEPLIVELIESQPFQRLKAIHQYGLTPYLTSCEDYKRYEHSLGVFLLLRKHERPLLEQVAGLLHDVSHTVFSHVGDYVFSSNPGLVTYHDNVHVWYLEQTGLASILNKYGISADEVDPENFPLIKRSLPDLCADRIDYNLQGGFLRGLISKTELESIWNDLAIENEKWILHSVQNAEVLANASLIMTETLWGSPWESIINRLGAKAIKRALDKNIVTFEEFHLSHDGIIWNKLLNANDNYIQNILNMLTKAESSIILTKKGNEDFLLYEKFRGINPLVKVENNFYYLDILSPQFEKKFNTTKETMKQGWAIIWPEAKKILEIEKD